MSAELGSLGVPMGILGGAIRISTPFLFVSLGECLTEKSGRVNLGLEGTLVMGAMCGYGASYLTGSAWLGVVAAGTVGALLGALHAWLCAKPRVNDIAVGIALMLLGVGLAFFFGKPLVKPSAPHLPALALGFWSDVPQIDCPPGQRTLPRRPRPRAGPAVDAKANTLCWTPNGPLLAPSLLANSPQPHVRSSPQSRHSSV